MSWSSASDVRAYTRPDHACLIVTFVALALIVSNRLRPDLVALLVLLTLGITQIVTPQQALAGFSNSAVITIIGLFVITAALERTGVVAWHWLIGWRRSAAAAKRGLLQRS